MADVFDEISDDLRRASLQKFWDENKNWIIGGALGAVLLTGALSFWRQWEFRRDEAATAELVKIAAGADAASLETFAKDTGKNHAAAARFLAAAAHARKGENKEALALYAEIADTSRLDRNFRDLAKLYSIGLRLETGNPADLEGELKSISGDKDPWRYSAREMSALLAARQGQTDRAAAILAAISADPAAPSEARTRAFMLRSFYAGNKTDPKS